MNFENSLNYLISDLSTVFRTEMEKSVNTNGVHSGQVFILFELWNKDGLSQIEMAANLNLAPPTINKLVKGLKDSGFVFTQRSDVDTRIVNVFLTEKGLTVKPKIEEIWRQLENKLTANLTDTEKLIFMQLLEKVLLNFYNQTETKLTGAAE